MIDILSMPSAEQLFSYKNTDTPYYTTYPPGGEWNDNYSPSFLESDLQHLQKNPSSDAALYLHVPFCEKLCYFCFCHTKIIKDKNNSAVLQTIQSIISEINLYGDSFESNLRPHIRQLQLGGGSPTYLSQLQLTTIVSTLRGSFDFSRLDEFAIEVDPRTLEVDGMLGLFEMGVNRVSLGIQDFDPAVQLAINRVQPVEMVANLLTSIDPSVSINFDLIYGLPHQTIESFNTTLEHCLRLDVNRLSVYCYDHTPEIYKHHAMMDSSVMPTKRQKIEMFLMAAEKLTSAGYVWVGVDHFAKKNDSLAIAKHDMKLGRTLNGYSTFREYDSEFGIGPSAISSLPTSYIQNIKSLSEYSAAVQAKVFPVLRGWQMSEDDLIRRRIIMQIILYAQYALDDFEAEYGMCIFKYFENLRRDIDKLIIDGLIYFNNNIMLATPLGRYYIYHIAKAFDKYTVGRKHYIRTHAAVKMLNPKSV